MQLTKDTEISTINRHMSDFSELSQILPLHQISKIKDILENENPLPKEKLASHLTMIILMANLASQKRKDVPVKRSTFLKYQRSISKTLQYDSSTKTVSFEYHLKDPSKLIKGLEDVISPYRFVVGVHEKPDDVMSHLSAVHMRKEAGRKRDLGNKINDEITKIAETQETIWGFVGKTMDLIEARTSRPATKAAYNLLLQATFMNCCRADDLKNTDIKTFEVIPDKHLGRMLRAFVPETKTGTRFVYFFPCKGRCDPLLALDSYLQWTDPIPKTRTTDEDARYEYQLLRNSLLGSYDGFISKQSDESIFKIPNGPKAHLGRHVTASYLSNNEMDKEATLYGNWSAAREEGVSRVAKARYMHTIEKSPPSYLFAFLSGFYNITAERACELVDPNSNPCEQDKNIPMISDIETLMARYGKNAEIIPMDVLVFLCSYARFKNNKGKEYKLQARSSRGVPDFPDNGRTALYNALTAAHVKRQKLALSSDDPSTPPDKIKPSNPPNTPPDSDSISSIDVTCSNAGSLVLSQELSFNRCPDISGDSS